MMQIYPYENVEKSKLFFRGVTEAGVRDTVSGDPPRRPGRRRRRPAGLCPPL